jgi:hypothetical protein
MTSEHPPLPGLQYTYEMKKVSRKRQIIIEVVRNKYSHTRLRTELGFRHIEKELCGKLTVSRKSNF